MCVLECPVHVFRFNFDKHIPEVIKPSKCKVGCTTCVNLCLAKAIILPPIKDIHDLMKRYDILGRGWRNLEYNKYMWI